jgi:putative FmdB family regulatory protein
MPLYEYKCTKCNEQFEVLLLKQDETVTCPRCNTADVEKLMSACAVKSGGTFTPSTGSSGCASCSGGNCSACH